MILRIALLALFGVWSLWGDSVPPFTRISPGDFGNTITFSELSEFDSPGIHRQLSYQTIMGVTFAYTDSSGHTTPEAYFTTTPSLSLGSSLSGAVIEGDGSRFVHFSFGSRTVTKVGLYFGVASNQSLSDGITLEAFDSMSRSLGIAAAPAVSNGLGTAHGGVFVEDTGGIQQVRLNFMSRGFILDNLTYDDPKMVVDVTVPEPHYFGVMSAILAFTCWAGRPRKRRPRLPASETAEELVS